MSHNLAHAASLRRLAALLDLHGEARSRGRGLRQAARTVEALDAPLSLDLLPTLDALSEEAEATLSDLLQVGCSPLLDTLERHYPAFLITLVDTPGLGSVRVRALVEALDPSSAADVVRAAEAGRLDGLAGFNDAKIALILDTLRPLVASPVAATDALGDAESMDESMDEGFDFEVEFDDAASADALLAAASADEEEDTFDFEVEFGDDIADAPAAPPPPPITRKPRRALSPDDESTMEMDQRAAHRLQIDPPSPAPKPDPDAWLWETLHCAACHTPALTPQGTDTVLCGHCGRRFRVEDGIIDLFGALGSRGLLGAAVNFQPAARIYESLSRPVLTRLVRARRPEEAALLHADMLDLKSNQTVVDVACNRAQFTRYIARAQARLPGSRVIGIDLSWDKLKRAQNHPDTPRTARFIRGNALRLPIRDGGCDRVHCSGALRVLSDPNRALKEVARVLRPDGLFVLGTYLESPNPLRQLPIALSGRLVGLRWFARDALRANLENAGFEVLREDTEGLAVSIQARRV